METNLYRKYRPVTFDEVVGQKVVVKTLINSIKNQSIAHAYLFSGVRGTGKTSIAKIFARAINCQNPDNPQCGECDVCQEFASQSEMPDIFELDAASNNGVEEIRKIIDNVKFMPLRLKYKVYIIDEVHMLSKGAFNALLKTLEEPPGHVIFILATTEPNKIPVTILSRVQRFDFNRIEEADMHAHLCKVLDLEAIEYESAAIDLIVTHAQGGLRDGLSLLTKVVSFAKSVTVETVTESLNLTSLSVTAELLDAIITNQSEVVSSNFKQLINSGADESYLVQDLIEAAKGQLIACLSEDPSLASEYTKIITKLMEALANIKQISNSPLYIEVILIELSLKKQEVIPRVEPVAAKPVVQELTEQEKLDKLKKQAELLASKESNEPEPETKPQVQKPESVETSKSSQEDNVELQMDILFSNKTGFDATPYRNEETQVDDAEVIVESEETQETIVQEEPVVVQEQQGIEQEPVIEEPAVVQEEELIQEEVANVELEEEKQEAETVEESIASSVAIEPKIEEVDNVESSVEKVTDNENHITIVDTLRDATKQDRALCRKAAKMAENELNSSKQYGLAKFFEVSTVQGASPTGIVVSVDQNLFATYESRLDKIESIYSHHVGSKMKVHLITTQYWQRERTNYIRIIEESKGVDIFAEAQNFFGKDIVTKVNT